MDYGTPVTVKAYWPIVEDSNLKYFRQYVVDHTFGKTAVFV